MSDTVDLFEFRFGCGLCLSRRLASGNLLAGCGCVDRGGNDMKKTLWLAIIFLLFS